MQIRDLIDKARDETGANYTEIATRLGRSKQLISNWRSGAKIPEDDDVMSLARMASEKPDAWLAIAQAARSHGAAKVRWEAIAKQLGAVAAVVAVAVVALPLLQQHDGLSVASVLLANVHYAKWIIAAIVAALLATGSRGNRCNARLLPL